MRKEKLAIATYEASAQVYFIVQFKLIQAVEVL